LIRGKAIDFPLDFTDEINEFLSSKKAKIIRKNRFCREQL
jgi:hypothetical protein